MRTVQVLWLLSVTPVCAGDFYIITGTVSSQGAAQTEAAVHGGWVLDTDIYASLAPNMFAIVRGPFRDESSARKELESMTARREYRDAYVKDAGKPRLVANLGSAALRPQLLAALLGELSVEVTDYPGGEDTCEPQEPYQEVQMSFVDLSHSTDKDAGEVRVEAMRRVVDIGRFRIIKRTGEISRMRRCYE